MFKKGCVVNNKSLLSGADRKKLRRGIENNFCHSEGDEEEGSDHSSIVDLILPKGGGDLELLKCPSPSRVHIYCHDKVPIIIDASGKGDLIPTIFALWWLAESPCSLLPIVHVKHPYVSRYLVNGADLMIPGVSIDHPTFPRFAKDQLVAICVPGNPCPLAVGRTMMSSEELLARQGSGGVGGVKGRLVSIVHCYGDGLWASMEPGLGNKRVPNAGFLVNAVVPVGAGAEALDGDDDDDDDGGGQGGEEEEEGEGEGGREEGQGASQDAVKGIRDLSVSQTQGTDPLDMDSLLELTLLQALFRAVKDSDLPMNGSSLWSRFMLPSRPAGCTLDLKKSRHKKMGAFLKAYSGDKHSAGLLLIKEEKNGEVLVTSINRGHQLLDEFRPLPVKATEGGSAAALQTSEAESAPIEPSPLNPVTIGGGGGASSSSSHEIVVEELWKCGRELRELLDALNLSSESLFTEKEAGEVAFSYVKEAKLEDPSDPKQIILDALLCDALFKGLIKKGEPFPTHIAKASLRESFLKRCIAQTRIIRGSEVVVKKGPAPVIRISHERRQGHKLTRVVGLEPYLSPDLASAELQKRFASSTAVNELPGKGQGSEVIIQGHHLGVDAFIVSNFLVPKRCVDFKK